jgi:5-methyltetrahydropteroyltriglutamate--homocysteine methyltransferase
MITTAPAERRRWIMPRRSTRRSATCFAAGADVVQLDEPYMQARPEAAREYGLEALNRALEGVGGRTCVHICFGYAALIHARPEGYSYLPELAGACCDQVSIETAQSNLDCSVLDHLPDKDILLGVLDLSTPEVEDVATITQRVRRALDHVNPRRVVLAPDCGMKYLSPEAAYGKLANMVAAARDLREEFGAAAA